MGYRNYGPANGFVVSPDGTGDFKTINAALTAAAAKGGTGTIFLKPATYSENCTLVSGWNLTAWQTDSYNIDNTGLPGSSSVIINGKLSYSGTGTVNICGIQLKTNGDFFLSVSGSNISTIYLSFCELNALNNTGISYSNSNASSLIYIKDCQGNIGTTGIGMWISSSAGTLSIVTSTLSNTGGSTTASSNSAGQLALENSTILIPISCSSTGFIASSHCEHNTSAQNATCLTTSGTGASEINFGAFSSGTASSISVGTGTTLKIEHINVSSSNTNAITGLGTINIGYISFSGSSSTINTSTISLLKTGKTLSFTPVLQFGGGTTGITYTTQQGIYTVSNGFVYFTINIVLSNKGSSTGTSTITGLPIASNSSTGTTQIFLTAGGISNASATYYSANLAANATTLTPVLYIGSTGVSSSFTDTSYTNTSSITIQGFYQI